MTLMERGTSTPLELITMPTAATPRQRYLPSPDRFADLAAQIELQTPSGHRCATWHIAVGTRRPARECRDGFVIWATDVNRAIAAARGGEHR